MGLLVNDLGHLVHLVGGNEAVVHLNRLSRHTAVNNVPIPRECTLLGFLLLVLFAALLRPLSKLLLARVDPIDDVRVCLVSKLILIVMSSAVHSSPCVQYSFLPFNPLVPLEHAFFVRFKHLSLSHVLLILLHVVQYDLHSLLQFRRVLEHVFEVLLINLAFLEVAHGDPCSRAKQVILVLVLDHILRSTSNFTVRPLFHLQSRGGGRLTLRFIFSRNTHAL